MLQAPQCLLDECPCIRSNLVQCAGPQQVAERMGCRGFPILHDNTMHSYKREHSKLASRQCILVSDSALGGPCSLVILCCRKGGVWLQQTRQQSDTDSKQEM